MSVIKIGKSAPKLGLASIVSQIGNEVNMSGNQRFSQALGKGAASLESLSGAERQDVERGMQENFEFLAAQFNDQQIKVSQEQLAAGALVMTAIGNPEAFDRKAMTYNVVSQEGIHVVPVDGSTSNDYGYLDGTPSLEAFDNTNLTDFLHASVTYNIQAARQDAFGELFFRTVPLTPEHGGVDMSVRDRLVMNTTRHDSIGNPTNFKEKRLLQAAINHKILENEPLNLVPEVRADGANAQYFVPVNAVANRTVDLGNRVITTRPLVVGKEVNLIGVAQNTLMAKNGVANNTDALDKTVGVESIYIRLGAGGDVFRFDIANLPRSSFHRPPEGRGEERVLTFINRSLLLNDKTVLASGAAPASSVLQEIKAQGLSVKLSVRLTGSVDLEYANATIDRGSVSVFSITNNRGEKLAKGDDVYDSIVEELADLEIFGWEPKARLSNSNKREEGLLLNSSEWTERYPVPLGQPLSIPSPLSENRPASDINDLIAAARLRNSNNAVTKLLEYADALESTTLTEYSPDEYKDLPEIEGIGRFLVNPWFRRTTLHLPNFINSLTSHERLADVSAVLVNAVRDGVYDAYRDSNIKTALDVITGYTGEKVKVLIGTDPVLSRYLMTPGDTRTLADDLDFEKVSSVDARVKNKIFYTFGRDGEGLDPLNFGSHLWVTELIHHTQVHRDGANIREAMVHPRSRHVVHLPILGVIEVTGLSDVVNGRVNVPVDVVATPEQDVDAIGNETQPGAGGEPAPGAGGDNTAGGGQG